MTTLVLAMGVSIFPANISSAEAVPTYVISFDANDGTGVAKKIKKLRNEAIMMPDLGIIHDGFTLIGFSTDKYRLNPEYTTTDDFNENEKTTLYAIWRRSEDLDIVDYVKPTRTINASNKSVKKKKSVKIGAKANGQGKAKFTYKSSNKKVAKVSSSGKITGVKSGKAIITITSKEDGLYGKSTEKITVTVK